MNARRTVTLSIAVLTTLALAAPVWASQSRPDVKLQRKGNATVTGDNIYSGEPGEQVRRGKVAPGKAVTFYVCVQNDEVNPHTDYLQSQGDKGPFIVNWRDFGGDPISDGDIEEGNIEFSQAFGQTDCIVARIKAKNSANHGDQRSWDVLGGARPFYSEIDIATIEVKVA